MTATLTFWGTRGSVPVSGTETAHYGGNTPCLVLESPGLPPIILDAGTGLRAYGATLNNGGFSGVLLLSHTHWDHIQGLPFFAPLWRSGSRLAILGPRPEHRGLAETLARQMDPDVFPVPFERFAGEVSVTEITETSFALGDTGVLALRLHHPGVAFGYRLSPAGGGREVAYLTDNELRLGSEPFAGSWRRELVGALSGVHTLVHDAAYDEATAATRRGWGHSTPEEAVALAADVGCRRLVLFHHEPGSDDLTVNRMLSGARALARTLAPDLEVMAAADGSRLSL